MHASGRNHMLFDRVHGTAVIILVTEFPDGRCTGRWRLDQGGDRWTRPEGFDRDFESLAAVRAATCRKLHAQLQRTRTTAAAAPDWRAQLAALGSFGPGAGAGQGG